MIEEDLKHFLGKLEPETFLYCSCSSSQDKTKPQKITIRPIKIKNVLAFQVSEQIKEKVIHQNKTFEEIKLYLLEASLVYKQIIIQTTEHDYHLLFSKSKMKILSKKPTKSLSIIDHNKTKKRLLPENEPSKLLIELDIMSAEGQVKKNNMDKFVQVNRFLETIQDVLPSLNTENLFVVDYGCGSALLTFALYEYLRERLKLNVEMWGLDLKEDVITKCQKLAEKLGYSHLHFKVQDINDHVPPTKIDLIVSLHACDTATDAVLEKGITWGVPVILAVPCCQKEIAKQIENRSLRPLLKHGILKEKFSALVTDAARAQLLTMSGYNTDVIEFIDMEHTPKNVMIRAVKHHSQVPEEVSEDYKAFAELLRIHPFLEKKLKSVDES